MNRIIISFFCICLLPFQLSAQELNCKVTVNGDAILTQQTTDKQVFVDLQNAISDFMNNKRWTSDVFAADERIKCNLVVTFTKSPQQNVFIGSAQFIIVRPVFGTTYESVIFTYTDKIFNISFLPEDRQMIFNEANFNNNLTSILGFYALIALGIDYDSFGKLGGSQYFQRAYNVANLAASASQSGWQQNEDQRNRYWLIENFMNQQLQPFREGFYTYHRQALDNFSTDQIGGRKQVLDLLNVMKGIQSQKSSAAVIMYGFFDAKDKELVNIFSEAPKDERQKVFNILSTVDPGKTENYRRLMR